MSSDPSMFSTAGPEDVVDGVPAKHVARPGTPQEVAAVLREAAAQGWSVVVRGSGSKLGWGAPPRSADLVLDTTAMNEISEHAPGDLIVRAQAGVRLDALQERVGGSQQLLALDPPEPGTTLGGLVAANASGPRRLRYGTARDLLIGVTVVLADGTIAMAGGKVVKNVAGYDLGKLYTGSMGTLGVIVETIFRLHPVAATQRVVTMRGPSDVTALVQSIMHSDLVPTAVELDAGSEGVAVSVLIEGPEPAVVAQAGAAQELSRAAGAESSVAEEVPSGFGQHPDSPVLVKLSFEPAALGSVLAALGDGAAVRGSAAVGVLYAGLPDAGLPDRLGALRSAIAPYDGTAVVLRAPAELKAGLDVWGPIGSALPLMRRVKDNFDPDSRLSPGRFVGGI